MTQSVNPNLRERQERQLWQPDRHEQLAACDILLASPLPSDARVVIRDLEQNFRTGKGPS